MGAILILLGWVYVQIEKLERLENPNLWEMYCTHRERLMRRLKFENKGAPFAPLEKVKGSTGPVKTTQNVGRQDMLNKERFYQVG